MSKARVIALYLPQFHPIPENDLWWGKGFTEWTNVGKAMPLFKGHYQPRVPKDLGYYDLRVPETRIAQAKLAKEAGIEGFCYWHYWFGNGKRLLERPFNEVLSSGKPDFPFCLAWANETWKGFDHGLKNRNTLIEQLYPGIQDYIDHFNTILPALKDNRYITVDGKPLFMIYKPHQIPDANRFINLWQKLAIENGLKGIYFVGHIQSRHEFNNETENETLARMLKLGFDAVNFVRLNSFLENRKFISKAIGRINKFVNRVPLTFSYGNFFPFFTNNIDNNTNVFPTLIPGWDHTPRSGKDGLVLTNSTPKLFGNHIEKVLDIIINKPDDKKIIFLKSWNEWAEGNYVEPDLRWGKQYLEIMKRKLHVL